MERQRGVPLVERDVCVECGEPLYIGEFKGRAWFTCSICGKFVCEKCQKQHVPFCFAKTWGMVEQKDEELIPVEKPRSFALK